MLHLEILEPFAVRNLLYFGIVNNFDPAVVADKVVAMDELILILFLLLLQNRLFTAINRLFGSAVIIALLGLLVDDFLLPWMCSLVRGYIQVVEGPFLILFKLVLGIGVVHIIAFYFSILVHIVFQA